MRFGIDENPVFSVLFVLVPLFSVVKDKNLTTEREEQEGKREQEGEKNGRGSVKFQSRQQVTICRKSMW